MDQLSNSLLFVFQQIEDPRKLRGVRHGFAPMLAMTLLGMICRQTDMASICRWAKDHWRTLKAPLGFTRKAPPHPTTVSRALELLTLEEFRGCFTQWLLQVPQIRNVTVACVDGKTSKQGYDADGDPIHMLNIFAQELHAVLAQYPVGDGKATEPKTFLANLDALCDAYPFLKLFTGDALFAQRGMAQAIVDANRNYLFVVKENQPDILEAIRTSFEARDQAKPDAVKIEKKRAKSSPANFGSSKAKRSTISARD